MEGIEEDVAAHAIPPPSSTPSVEPPQDPDRDPLAVSSDIHRDAEMPQAGTNDGAASSAGSWMLADNDPAATLDYPGMTDDDSVMELEPGPAEEDYRQTQP